jgi:membrane-associated PAP2 superfamily phosphatase
MTLSLAFRSARWVRARRWHRASGYVAITLVLAASIVGLIANGVAHDGAIVFRWKG